MNKLHVAQAPTTGGPVPSFDEQAQQSLQGIARLFPVRILNAEATVERAYFDAKELGRGLLVVVNNDNQPIKVVHTSSLKQLMGVIERRQLGTAVRGPDFLIAEITTTFKSVMDQVEALGLTDRTFVVVTDSQGETVGATTIESLHRDLGHRQLTGAALPGRPKIPPLVRCCKYQQSHVGCPHTQQFQTRPPVMPRCANPLRLNSHAFVW